jgi:hypothetical protein
MKTFFAPAACAAAILLSSVSVDAVLAPAAAQQDVSFDSFHDYLANYGAWVYSDRWGEVWVPENVPDDFQPYGTNGYWAPTDDYGWVWASNYEWGDVPFHYGRWVNDPDDGWLWIPGYVWSPAWVVWRHSGQYTGWMPMPPDREFLGQSGPSIGIGLNIGAGINIGIDFNDTSSYYGYSQWYPGYDANRFASNWVFVGTAHLADPDFHRYWAPRNNYVTIIHNTTNITNYTVVNNYIVNRGVSFSDVQRASGHPVVHVSLTQAIKRPQFVAQANKGVEIQQHMRQVNPRGDGRPNSAPKPSAAIVQGLSNKVPQHDGHPPAHVFSKTTVTKAPAFAGKIAPAAGGAASAPAGGPNAHEDKLKKPAETGGAPAGETMHQPGGMKGPGSTTSGPGASQEEKLRKPAETGGAGTTHAPNTVEPAEHHLTPPSSEAPATSAPTVLHKHEDTGGATTAPTHERDLERKQAPAAAPVAAPPVQREERRLPPAAAPVATPPVQREERRPPPAAAPVATPPVQREEHKPPPAAAPAAAPPKPEDKDKKKDEEPH